MSFVKDTVVKESDIFLPINYPLIADELAMMKNELALIPVYFKAEIIISFLKNHCIKNEWIKANPQLTLLITSGALRTTNIESVFRGCIKHKVFLHNFESYIRMQILN